MSCPACERATRNWNCGIFMGKCLSCEARRLALSPMAHRAMAGDRADLQAAIAAIWKDDVDTGRALVWEWMQRINKPNG